MVFSCRISACQKMQTVRARNDSQNSGLLIRCNRQSLKAIARTERRKAEHELQMTE